ncbi:MAG: hypothetical protein Q9162_000778 [Coniocarpon cinnabarinum]
MASRPDVKLQSNAKRLSTETDMNEELPSLGSADGNLPRYSDAQFELSPDDKSNPFVDAAEEPESTQPDGAPDDGALEQEISGPSATPVGLNANFISQQSSSLTLHRHANSWNRGSYTVKMADESESKFLRAGYNWYRYSRTIFDANDAPLYSVSFSYWRLPLVFYINNQGQKVVEMVWKWKMTKVNADIKFTNLDGEQTLLKLSTSGGGNGQFTIKSGDDRTVAYIHRREYNKQLYKEKKTGVSWDFNVAANVDKCLKQMLLNTATSSGAAAGAGA